ncbi:MAG: glycosyltransferase involved in cell wall biosynthesis [Parvicella sp.]|jgi:glycosyltransferase involved in cell wall biosynthesis
MKKLKVLETIRQGLVGGGETHVYDLSTHLNRNLFEPVVLSFTEGPMVENLRKVGIKTYVIHSKIPFDPRVTSRVRELVKAENIELIHAHGSRAASNVVSVARALEIPIIYTVHGWSFNDQQSRIMKFLRIKAEAYLIRRVDEVICVSASNEATGKEVIKAFNCVVINNGISLNKFTSVANRQELRNQLGFKEEEVWVGFIARLTFQKDPINLLEAFRKAVEVNKSLRLLMVGEGDLEEEVATYIQENDLSEVVLRMPFQANVPELLAAIDIYSLVSHWEGLPIGLLEAMASSKAIIASNVDGTKEVIVSNKNGLLIKNGSSQELCTSILSLASDRNKRTRFGSAAFDSVAQNFSLKVMVENTEKVYKRRLS